MRMRRSVTSLAVAVAAMTGIALTPGTANASTGGGCGTDGSLKACISASGSNVEPDFYITAPTPGCTNINITVWDNTINAVIDDFNYPGPCGPEGHYGPGGFDFTGQNGHQYQTVITESSGNGWVAVSPILTFSD